MADGGGRDNTGAKGLRAPVHDDEEVANVQRTRLGQLLVALGLVLFVVSGLGMVLGAVLRSPSVASDAAPDLVVVDVVRAPIEAELAAAVAEVLPAGSMSAETAAAVAARMVRDDVVVDEIARASADASDAWQAEDQAVLVLDPAVVTPAAIAALRDIDLSLARVLSDAPSVQVVAAPIALPVTTTSAGRIDTAAALCQLGLIVSVALVVLGGIFDPRRDRTIRSISTALAAGGVVLVAAPFLARIPDLATWDWRPAFAVAMIAAAVVPLVVGGVACLALGAFLRAVASQAAPSVTARIEKRERDAVTPPPAPTGPQLSRRRGRQVRQQAIDAFFGPEDGDTDVAVEDSPADTEQDERTEPAVLRAPVHSTGAASDFDRALDAASEVRRDDRTPEAGEDDDAGAGEDEQVDPAEAAAADRREALERISGRRNRLRTHLPR